MNLNNFNETIGRNLRALRRERGLTQKQVAAALGVTFQQVQKYEKGVTRLPLECLYRLRLLFGVTTECFFEGIPELPVQPLRPSHLRGICKKIAAIPSAKQRNKAFRIIAILGE